MTTIQYRSGQPERICDFCSSGVPMWRYPARPVQSEIASGLAVSSTDDWLACDECSALIEFGNPAGLLERAIASLGAKHGIARVEAQRPALQRTQAGFFEHRTGDRIPFG